MSDKPFFESTWLERNSMIAFISLIAIVFTLLGFFIHPKATEILWDKLHPFSFFDFIGCAVFYGGCVVISGVLRKLRFYNNPNSIATNVIWFVGILLGVVLIWNL